MNECARCGASGENVKLNHVISSTGIVKLCDECAASENLPVVKRPTEEQLNSVHRTVSVRDRLENMNKTKLMAGKDVSLREIVDRKFKAKGLSHPDLIENFHWTIQRIKRARKITREEFAKAIGESDATVRMIEQGFIPENNYQLISKIENYLKVNLRKPGASGFPNAEKFKLDSSLNEKEIPKELPKKFNQEETKKFRISDLLGMKKKQEEKEIKKPSVDSWEEEYPQDDERFLDKEFNEKEAEED